MSIHFDSVIAIHSLGGHEDRDGWTKSALRLFGQAPLPHEANER